MNCAENNECPAKNNQELDCWEIFGSNDSRSFNICRDCIVYIPRQEEQSAVSQTELEEIMLRKGIIISPCGAFTLQAQDKEEKRQNLMNS